MGRREGETETERQLGQTNKDIERGECVCGGAKGRGGGGGRGVQSSSFIETQTWTERVGTEHPATAQLEDPGHY